MSSYIARTMLFIVFFTMASCGPNIPENLGKGNENGNDDNDYEAIWPVVSDFFSDSCASSGCHGPGSHILELAGEASYDSIVNVSSEQLPSLNLVHPGDPIASYLYLKLLNLHISACVDASIPESQCGTEMPPPPRPMLSQARLNTIRDWIADEAKREE